MKREDPGLLHKRAAAIFHAEGDQLQELQAALGHPFADLPLLTRALTHPSLAGQDNNQRLEFLGDAVLQLCVSELLYALGSDAEGRLTFKRQRLVCQEALADVARGIGLGGCLLMSEGLHTQGGAKQDSVLADAMEAVLAAVYLDSGLDAARELVKRLWKGRIISADPNLDPKSALQAWAAAKGFAEPEYRLMSEDGPPHRRSFTVEVFLGGRKLSRGTGKTKKAAQQEAAQLALDQLEEAKGEE